jgi:hypothetical protein
VLTPKMIRTDVPMIDVLNCLVDSRKIAILSVSGEPFNPFLARIGIQAQADIVVFGGMGLIFDDYYFFCTAFEDAGVFARTVMYVNLVRAVRGRRRLASCDETIQDRPSKDGIWGMSVEGTRASASRGAAG